MCVWQCGFLSPSSPPGALCGLGGHLQVHLLSGLPPSTHIHGIGALSGTEGTALCSSQNTRVSLWPSSATNLLCNLRLFTFVHDFVLNSENTWLAFCLTPRSFQETYVSWRCDPVPLASASKGGVGHADLGLNPVQPLGP